MENQTIGPVFLTVTEKPNQPHPKQILIRFSGPPDTSVYVDLIKQDKAQGTLRLIFFNDSFFNLRGMNCRKNFKAMLTSFRQLNKFFV